MLAQYLLSSSSSTQPASPAVKPGKVIDAEVVVIGAGPAGRIAAERIAAGRRVCVIIDPVEFPGGSNLVAGAEASKTMWKYIEDNFPRMQHPDASPLSYQEGKVEFSRVQQRVRDVIKTQGHQNLGKVALCDEPSSTDLNQQPIFIQGWGRITSDGLVEICRHDFVQIVRAPNIVIATGSTPRAIDSLPWTEQKIVSSDNILSLEELPQSMVIVGAGIVGIEYASYFRALGVDVTLINRSESILTGTEDIIYKGVAGSLQQLGVKIIPSNGVKSSLIDVSGKIHLELNDGAELHTDVVLVAAGRVPNIENIIPSDDEGLTGFVKSRAATPQTFDINGSSIEMVMIGDVGSDGGIVPKALNQGYRVGEYCVGHQPWETKNLDKPAPTAIFSFPPAAYVGLTEETAKEMGYSVICGAAPMSENAMAVIGDSAAGEIKLVFDAKNGALLGAHIIGPEAHELINLAVPYLHREGALTDLQGSSFAHPSFSGAYRGAAQTIEAGVGNHTTISAPHVSSDVVHVPGRQHLAHSLNSLALDPRRRESEKISLEEVLIVIKSSRWSRMLQAVSGDETVAKRQSQEKGIDLEPILVSHREQQQATEELRQAFPGATIVSREEFEQFNDSELAERFQAVLALGGDNHAQWVSHRIRDHHIFIGVNSDTTYSAGNTLQFTWHDLQGIAGHLRNGSYVAKPVTRLQAHLNENKLPVALSEIFIGQETTNIATIAEILPGSTKPVRSKSSGYLVAAPMGSTGWTGKVLEAQYYFNPAIDSSTRGGMVVRREHFSGGGAPFSATVLNPSEVLTLVSEMNTGGVVSIDSDRATQFEFNRGAVLTISVDESPLWWFEISEQP